MEEGNESVLEAIFDDENVDQDIEMLDAEAPEDDNRCDLTVGSTNTDDGGLSATKQEHLSRNSKRRANRKKKRNKKERPMDNVFDMNRFVIDTCKHLKERKPYLVWNAIACLGISAVKDLVKEVYAVQNCGGQLTADGKRFRTGGGVLWNILKKREPNAYKEIMTKGKEFEKQFKQKNRQVPKRNTEATTAQGGHGDASDGPADQVSCVSQLEPEEHELVQNDCSAERVPIHGRLRAPVSYDDDLFGHGI